MPPSATDEELHIEKLVGFLSVYAPERLQQLQSAHPDQAILAKGRTLGKNTPTESELAAIKAATLTSLEVMYPIGEQAGTILRKRWVKADRIQLGGEIAAALGSGGVLTQLKEMSQAGWATTGAAVLALAGSITAIAVRHMRADLGGAEGGLLKKYQDVRDSAWKARTLIVQIKAIPEDELPKRRSIIEEANTFAGQYYGILKEFGGIVQLPAI